MAISPDHPQPINAVQDLVNCLETIDSIVKQQHQPTDPHSGIQEIGKLAQSALTSVKSIESLLNPRTLGILQFCLKSVNDGLEVNECLHNQRFWIGSGDFDGEAGDHDFTEGDIEAISTELDEIFNLIGTLIPQPNENEL